MSRRKLAVSRQFSSAVERVRWAERDIAELKELARQFFASDTHQRVCEPHPNGIYQVDKIKFRYRLPSAIAQRTVSTIENLRAALDIGACAVVPRHAKRKTYFPFGDTKKEFDRHLKSKAKYVPDEIKALFVKLKPYKRGNPPLWALNKLANTPKHVTIVHPGIEVKDITFPANRGLDFILRHSRPRWNSRKNEIIIATVAGETTIQHDVDMSLGVAFGKVPIVSGKSALGVLRYLSAQVERILWSMESEAIRIGIIK